MDLINTGQSTSLRERATSLKKQVQTLFGAGGPAKPGMDLATLHRTISDQSSIFVHERLLREVVRELLEEEWLMMSSNGGSLSAHNNLLRSNTILKRFE